jgi:RNA-binding protein YhbY
MLTGSERKALKARAHRLEPVVHIGAKGLLICEKTAAQAVQQAGEVFVLYRKNDE